MKKYVLTILAIILIAGIAFVSLSNGKTKTIKEDGILSVNDISSDPFAYKGASPSQVLWQTSHASKVPANVFSMVETSEAKICKLTGCARFYLPVKHEGDNQKNGMRLMLREALLKARNSFWPQGGGAEASQFRRKINEYPKTRIKEYHTQKGKVHLHTPRYNYRHSLVCDTPISRRGLEEGD